MEKQRTVGNRFEAKDERMWNIVNTFILAVFAFFVVNIARLYYHYMVHVKGDGFGSDIPTHIRVALNTGSRGYSLNNIVIRFLVWLTGSKMAVAGWIVFILIATCVVGGIIAWLFFGKPDRRYYPALLLLGTAPLFIGSIYIPHFYEHHYRGTLTATVWHNDTIIEMRLFAMITLLLFYLVMKRIKEESNFFLPWVFFVLALFLTTGTKTNFYISFCPLAGVILIVYLIRSLAKKKWKRSGFILLTGLSILAVFPVLFYQGDVLFGGSVSSASANLASESVSPIAWTHPAVTFQSLIVRPLLSALPFLVILIYSAYKKRVTKEWLFLVGLWGIDVFVSFFLKETGSRAAHGNFAWGRESSLYMLNFVSLIQYCRYMIEMRRGEHQETADVVALSIITILLFAALASGILYFYKLAWGGFGYFI